MDLCWDVEGQPGTLQVLQKRFGSMPVMVKSTACHLHGEQHRQQQLEPMPKHAIC